MRALRWSMIAALGLSFGCATREAALPVGHLPPPAGELDLHTATALAGTPNPVSAKPPASPLPTSQSPVFAIPDELPGANRPLVTLPKFDRDATPAEREKAIREAYPVLTPVVATSPGTGAALSLAELESLALANSPAIKRAGADAETGYGQVIQAGLRPNPTTGYQVDQVQPDLKIPEGSTASGAGQHGAFINLLIKTAGKLALAQKIAGFDYINALVAVRAARVSATTQVRSAYFTALVAQETLAVNKALADMADELYGLQLKRVAAGVDTGYEPLQVYAQAIILRNAHAQGEATARSAWKQLAAAVGQPDLPQAPLAGKASAAPPAIDEEAARAWILERHTELLTARNTLAQGQTNLLLQKKLPVPDLSTNQYHQYDNAAQVYQFGVQLGVQLPIFDRNQGNIRSAQSRIVSNGLALESTRNDLFGRLAEAHGRYRANALAVANYRDRILPSQTQAYRAIVRRYQAEPDKVSFGDIVLAQQNVTQAMQSYLTALDAQWRAVVDVANIVQIDELYPSK